MRPGVLRQVVRLGEDTEAVETVGSLDVEIDDEDIIGEPGEIVLYTLDSRRLRDMLYACMTGASPQDVMLALDAAALASDT